MFYVFFHEQEFYYPENVAYPVGGPGNPEFVVLEMHYDNPQLVSGIVLCGATDMAVKLFLQQRLQIRIVHFRIYLGKSTH